MKTREEELIKKLSTQTSAFPVIDPIHYFFLKWFIASSLFFSACAVILPFKPGLTQEITQPMFELTNALWLALSFSSTIAFYQSLFPENRVNRAAHLSWMLLGGLVLILLPSITFDHLYHDISSEMSFWKGRCGFLILAFAMVQSGVMLWWAKRAAPRKSGMIGIWASLASSSLGCLLMQFVCYHVGSVHTLVWHFVPLSLVTLASYGLAKKTLRW